MAGTLGQPDGRGRGMDPFGDDPFAPFFGRDRRERRQVQAPKLYVEAVPARTRVHVGEPILLTYYVYTQVSISDLQFKDAPQYPGFWAEDVEPCAAALAARFADHDVLRLQIATRGAL